MKENLEHLSPGMVIRSYPGLTAFPVKPASEVFEFAIKRLQLQEKTTPYVIYDPCCGGGYLATVLGLRFPRIISKVICSDIDLECLRLANENLKLLTAAGLDERISQIKLHVDNYGKESHKSALKYAMNIKSEFGEIRKDIPSHVFQFDLLGKSPFPSIVSNVDIIFADIPYGSKSHWKTVENIEHPINFALDRLREIASDSSIVLLALNRKSESPLSGFKKLKVFKFGSRRVLALERLS